MHKQLSLSDALSPETVPMSACPRCKWQRGIVGSGTGPHAAALKCASCDRHIKWLSVKALAKIGALAAQAPSNGGTEL